MIDWRSSEASSLDDKIATHGMALAWLAQSHGVAASDGNERLCAEIRALAASLRADASLKAGKARDLRNAIPDPDGDSVSLELVAATTTRHVRRLAP